MEENIIHGFHDGPTFSVHALRKLLPGSHPTGNWRWIDEKYEKNKTILIQHPNNDTCIGLLSASK